MIDVNLLPPKDLISSQSKKVQSRLTNLSLVSIVLVLAVTGVVMGLEIYLTRAQDSLKFNQEVLTKRYGEKAKTAYQIQTIKHKVAGLLEARASALDFPKLLASVNSLLTDGMSVESLSLQSNGETQLSVAANGLFAINSFLNNFSQTDQPIFLSDVVLGGLRQLGGGGFNLQVSGKFDPTKYKLYAQAN